MATNSTETVTKRDVKTRHEAIPLSDYAKRLDSHVKERYMEKVAIIGIDPLLISEGKHDPKCLPPVEAAD